MRNEPFDWEVHNARIARQAELAAFQRLNRECRQLRDADRRFYRLGIVIFLVCMPLLMGPMRYVIDLTFDNLVPQEFWFWRKWAIIPMLTLYATMCALAVWAIFHRRY